MASANNVVTVSIVIQDRAASVPNFGSIVILAKGPAIAGGARNYETSPEGLAAMLTDGYTVGSAAYILASLIAAQSPTVPDFWTYNRGAQNAQQLSVTPTITTAGYVYSWTIVGPDGIAVSQTYEVPGSASVASICDAIAALIDGVAGPTDVSAVSLPDPTATHIEITPTDTGDRFYWRTNDAGFTVTDLSADAGIATDLAGAAVSIPDFYGVVLDSSSPAEIAAAAAWCESNKKILAAWNLETAVGGSGTSDVQSVAKTANQHYFAGGTTRDGFNPPIVALMARQFALDPGSSVWANKSLANSAVDDWSATMLANIRAKRSTAYVTMSGLPMTLDGMGASGRYLDVTRNLDWLKANLQSDLVSLLANQEVIPYTNAGLVLIESTIATRLMTAQAMGIIDSSWTITPPRIQDVVAADKVNRIVRNFRWTAKLQGGVQTIEVAGTIAI